MSHKTFLKSGIRSSFLSLKKSQASSASRFLRLLPYEARKPEYLKKKFTDALQSCVSLSFRLNIYGSFSEIFVNCLHTASLSLFPELRSIKQRALIPLQLVNCCFANLELFPPVLKFVIIRSH